MTDLIDHVTQAIFGVDLIGVTPNSALHEQYRQRVRDGLAAIEPTREMIDAMEQAWWQKDGSKGIGFRKATFREAFKAAMRVAAEQPRAEITSKGRLAAEDAAEDGA